MKKSHKILIGDYESALEESYEPTVKALKDSLGDTFDDYEIEIYRYENDEKLKKKLADCDGLITGFLEIKAPVLADCKRLKCISVSGVGYANIDVAAAKKNGVRVCHIAEYCTQEVAEHTFALIFALNRNLKYYNRRIEENLEWKYHTISGGHTLEKQTLGIFGLGKIGKRVGALANALGMNIIAYDPYAKKETAEATGIALMDADAVCKQADVISNHMNLTPENAGFFDSSRFQKMERKPLFINVGRGGSVVEKDLIRALDEGLIRGAGLDVLEAENPVLSQCGLLGRKNVILTPHSAFYSEDSVAALQRISGENMGYCLTGQYDKLFSEVH